MLGPSITFTEPNKMCLGPTQLDIACAWVLLSWASHVRGSYSVGHRMWEGLLTHVR